MGGMQVLEWAVMYPRRVRSLVPIATCMQATAQQIAWGAGPRAGQFLINGGKALAAMLTGADRSTRIWRGTTGTPGSSGSPRPIVRRRSRSPPPASRDAPTAAISGDGSASSPSESGWGGARWDSKRP